MNLRDAKAQVEREQPHLTGTAKIQAIKALRSQPKPMEAQAPEREPKSAEAWEGKAARKPASVGDAWAFLAVVIVGMRLVSYFVWGGVMDQPHWYDALYVILLIAAIAGLVSAYRNRNRDS